MKMREIFGIILTLLALSIMLLITFATIRQKLILFSMSLWAIGIIMAIVGIEGENFVSSSISALLIILGVILSLLAPAIMWYYLKFKP